jgi:hypothetical protein
VFAFTFTPGYQALSSGSLTPPNPLTCTEGTCYDGAIKYGYPSCNSGYGQRIFGTEIPVGTKTCYKSIRFNLERNSAFSLLIFASLFAVIARGIEYLLSLIYSRKIRWPVLFPLVFGFFPLYYSYVLLVFNEKT